MPESLIERILKSNTSHIFTEAEKAEIVHGLEIKRRIEGRIRSMTDADASCNQGLTNEGYAILGVLHDLLEVKP